MPAMCQVLREAHIWRQPSWVLAWQESLIFSSLHRFLKQPWQEYLNPPVKCLTTAGQWGDWDQQWEQIQSSSFKSGVLSVLGDQICPQTASFSGKYGSKLTWFKDWFPTTSPASGPIGHPDVVAAAASCRWQIGRKDSKCTIQGISWQSLVWQRGKAQMWSGWKLGLRIQQGIPRISVLPPMPFHAYYHKTCQQLSATLRDMLFAVSY